MIADLVGRQCFDFKDKETGKDVRFVKLYVAWNEEGIEGVKTDAINSNMEDAYCVEIGKRYNFLFERTAKGQAKLALIMPVGK